MTEYKLALEYYISIDNFHTKKLFDENVKKYGVDYIRYYYIQFHNEEYNTDWEV